MINIYVRSFKESRPTTRIFQILDADRAVDIMAMLEDIGLVVAAVPSRGRLTIAQIVAARDERLTKEIARKNQKNVVPLFEKIPLHAESVNITPLKRARKP